jgi:transglutaminase-like putative cysteine protease
MNPAASYDISLRIRYDYANPAGGGRHLIHLLPITRAGSQRLVAGHIDISPQVAERVETLDFFGNHTVAFAFSGSHDHVSLKLTARVERAAAQPMHPALPLEDLATALSALSDLGPASPLHFRAPSPRVPLDAAIARYGINQRQPGDSAADLVERLGRSLNHDMHFDPDAASARITAIS